MGTSPLKLALMSKHTSTAEYLKSVGGRERSTDLTPPLPVKAASASPCRVRHYTRFKLDVITELKVLKVLTVAVVHALLHHVQAARRTRGR